MNPLAEVRGFRPDSSLRVPGVALQRKRAALGFVTGQEVQREALDRPSRRKFDVEICSEDHAQPVS
jgi:hypothetical protein